MRTTLRFYPALSLQLICNAKLVQNKKAKILKGIKTKSIPQGKHFVNKCRQNALQHVNRHSNLLAVEEIENKTSIRYFSSWQQFDQKKKKNLNDNSTS